MAKLTKKQKSFAEKIDKNTKYSITDALSLVKIALLQNLMRPLRCPLT